MEKYSSEQADRFVEMHYKETIELLKSLAAIPAPSGKEERRTEFIKNWLCRQGAEAVQIDRVGNVKYFYPVEGKTKITVIMAHMDVVFEEEKELPVVETQEKLFAPGVGDDTANLVNLLMAIKYLLGEQKTKAESTGGILFVADVGEEGLGNLKGSREIMRMYGSRIDKWISFDLYLGEIYNKAVGSKRYLIEMKTQGGHSFGDFGRPNAIGAMAELIVDLYQQPIPGESKTTYNVGTIEGGTSINTIAADAAVTYEFRSESQECMEQMEKQFDALIEKHRGRETEINVKVLGVRPGMGRVEKQRLVKLTERCKRLQKEYGREQLLIGSASTDCNIPLSNGIPAVTLGTVSGGMLHTTEEWIDKESMKQGQKIALGIVRFCMEEEENDAGI